MNKYIQLEALWKRMAIGECFTDPSNGSQTLREVLTFHTCVQIALRVLT